MDLSERIAFIIVFLMGSYITMSQFLDMPYESVVMLVIGSLMLTFVAWAFLSDTLRKYRVVKVGT